MADVNLPSINELSQMQFLAPGQYATARNNINLANQFQQQNLQQGEYGLQKALMDNNYQAANDPVRLLSNQQDLGIKTSENIIKGADAEVRKKFLPEEIEAKKNAFIKGRSVDDLAALQLRAETDYAKPDSTPEQREAAKEVLQRTVKELHERNRAADTQANTRILVEGRKEVAGMGAEASKYGADQRRLAAEMKVNGVGKDAVATYQAAKGDVNQATAARGNAMRSEDPVQQKYWLDLAKFHEDKQKEIASIGAQERRVGQVDISQLPGSKIPTVQAPVSTLTAPQMPASLQQASAGPQRPFVGPAQTEPLPGQSVALELGPNGERINGLLKLASNMPDDNPDKPAFTAQLMQAIDRFKQGQAPAPAQAAPQQPAAPQPQAAVPQIPTSAQRPGGRVGLVGPDGSKVTVPAAQLQQALQSGYKLQ